MLAMKRPTILPAITSITKGGHQQKLKEGVALGLKTVAFFPTGLDLRQRKQFYPQLVKSPIKKIPFVHLRNDFAPWELDFLIKNFQTKVFNIHSELLYPLRHDLSQYRDRIFVENTEMALEESEIKKYAGICIDFSHLENDRRLKPAIFEHHWQLMQKYPCGCAHLGAVRKKPVYFAPIKEHRHDTHYLKDFSQLDYLQRYQDVFPPIMAIELENSLQEQLAVREEIKKLL